MKRQKKKSTDLKKNSVFARLFIRLYLKIISLTKTGKHLERLQVDMTQAPHALTYAGYDFDKNLLTHLFGAEKRIGRRTVKKLRDALTHSVNQKAIDELIDREEELHGYMDQFLSKIREFDSAA